jgi:hypothetical protein
VWADLCGLEHGLGAERAGGAGGRRSVLGDVLRDQKVDQRYRRQEETVHRPANWVASSQEGYQAHHDAAHCEQDRKIAEGHGLL